MTFMKRITFSLFLAATISSVAILLPLSFPFGPGGKGRNEGVPMHNDWRISGPERR